MSLPGLATESRTGLNVNHSLCVQIKIKKWIFKTPRIITLAWLTYRIKCIIYFCPPELTTRQLIQKHSVYGIFMQFSNVLNTWSRNTKAYKWHQNLIPFKWCYSTWSWAGQFAWYSSGTISFLLTIRSGKNFLKTESLGKRSMQECFII